MAGVITEIAAECGVSEQAVRAWCRRNHVAKDAKGSFAISESQKTAIYQHYLGVERKQVSQPAKASCETCETTLIAMLQGELDRKSEQLAVKDKQIEELKATDTMRWVGMMNNIRACADEIVLNDIVYS